jgi:hypothetical protein
MNDISGTVKPKSDQLNADDLIAKSMTLEITGVKVVAGDQPVHIEYKGGEGTPFKPCKSMRRIMIMAWGSDGDEYVGEKMIVYNDPAVKWAGSEVGGIRISHMTSLPNDEKLRVMLTETRGRRSPFVVEPIIEKPKNALSDDDYAGFCADMNGANTMAELAEIGKSIKAGFFDEAGSTALKAEYALAQKRIRTPSE